MAQPDTLKDLLAAFEKDEQLMNKLERAVFGSAESYQQSLTEALDDSISSLLTDDDGMIRSTVENTNIIEQLERDIDVILEENGLSEAKDEIVGQYKNRLDTVDNLVKEAGIDGATGVDFESLPEIQQEISKFTDSLDDATPEVAEIVRNEMLQFRNNIGSGGAVSFSDFRQTLITKAGIMPRYAGTVGNTQLAALDRTARIVQADKANIKKMKYMGVLDNLTRPFCRDQVGQVRTIEEWRNMKNNVSPQPVSKYCGGWNCRHRLMLWRDEFDRDSDQSAPQQGESQSQVSRAYDRRLDDRVDEPLPEQWKEDTNILLSDVGDVPFNFTGKDGRSFYSVTKGEVNVKGISGGKVRAKTVIHEYGHAIHEKNGLLKDDFVGSSGVGQKVADDYLEFAQKTKDKLREIIRNEADYATPKAWNKKVWDDIADEYDKDFTDDYDFWKSDDIENIGIEDSNRARRADDIGAFSDLIDSQFGGDMRWGHAEDYWRSSMRKLGQNTPLDMNKGFLKELFAHGMENRYKTNWYIRDKYPELHDLLENDFNDIVDRMIELKREQISD